jgi:hypothetical protein
MTTTAALRHFGNRIGPVETTDAGLFSSSIDQAMTGIRDAIGVLEPIDIGRIVGILQKYVPPGASGLRTNATGMTSTDEAATNRRKHDAELVYNRKVAQGFKDFWDKQNAELQRFGRR